MQIEWYRGYQIRLMFWDESFFVCWKKKNEIKQKEYGGYPFYVILTFLLSWKFNLSTIHRTKCRGTYVYCDGWFFINSGCIASVW